MVCSITPISRLGDPSAEQLKMIRQNDHAAFKQLLDGWEDLIAALGRKFGRRDRNDEDMQQLGRIALCRAAGTFDPNGKASFKTYARTVVANAMRDARRRSRVEFTCGTDDGAINLLNVEIIE